MGTSIIRDPRAPFALAVLLRVIQQIDTRSFIHIKGSKMMWPSWQLGVCSALTTVSFAFALWILSDVIIRKNLDKNRLFLNFITLTCSLSLYFLWHFNERI